MGDNKVPGPGNYSNTIKTGSEAPKYSMSAKNYNIDNNKKIVPGPGQYNNDRTFYTTNKAPTWRIGTSNRDDNMKHLVRQNFPGPGNYSSHGGDKGPKFSFGNEKRINDGNKGGETPGPGQYKIPTSVSNTPNFVSGGWDPNFKFV
jgi:hypothetical protein